jgi:hypothetical protein
MQVSHHPSVPQSLTFWHRLDHALHSLDPLQRERVVSATLGFHDALEEAGLTSDFDDLAKTWLTLLSAGVLQ